MVGVGLKRVWCSTSASKGSSPGAHLAAGRGGAAAGGTLDWEDEQRASDCPGKGDLSRRPQRSIIVAGRLRKLTGVAMVRPAASPEGAKTRSGTWIRES